MMSDHRLAMTSAREAYASASAAESLRRASFPQLPDNVGLWREIAGGPS